MYKAYRRHVQRIDVGCSSADIHLADEAALSLGIDEGDKLQL